MQFTQKLREMFNSTPNAPSLIFGLKRSKDEQMMFRMDCAAVNPNGFSANWGDRFLDPKDRKKEPSPRSRWKARGRANHIERSKQQQAIGMESRTFRKRRRLGELVIEELEKIKLLAPEMLSDRERHLIETKEITP